MNDDDILIKYLLGELAEQDAADLEARLRKDPVLQNELDLLRAVWDKSQSIPLAQPDVKATQRFEQWLADQEATTVAPATKALRMWRYAAAASVIMLLGAFWILQKPAISEESNGSTQTDLLHWAAEESSTERIKGIHATVREKEADPEIVEALLKVLRDDKSANVRLTAVEALQTMGSGDNVKQGLLKALATEKTPVVQIAIINVLVGADAKIAKEGFQNLINKEEIDSTVKDEAQLGLMRL